MRPCAQVLLRVDSLLEREGWSTAKEWHELLSLGEQQSLAIVRLLHQRPRYAVLDECMSAVDPAVTHEVYAAFDRRGITAISFGQALPPSGVARAHHSREIRLGGGGGGWEYKELDREEAQGEGIES